MFTIMSLYTKTRSCTNCSWRTRGVTFRNIFCYFFWYQFFNKKSKHIFTLSNNLKTNNFLDSGRGLKTIPNQCATIAYGMEKCFLCRNEFPFLNLNTQLFTVQFNSLHFSMGIIICPCSSKFEDLIRSFVMV